MGFLEVVLTILGALVIGLIFAYAFNVRGPWGSFWSFLLVLILAAFIAELWIPPIGPVYGGFGWLTTLFFVLLFALLLAAATPSRTTRSRADVETRQRVEEETEREAPAAALTIFFWIMLVLFFVAILYAIFI